MVDLLVLANSLSSSLDSFPPKSVVRACYDRLALKRPKKSSPTKASYAFAIALDFLHRLRIEDGEEFATCATISCCV